MDCIVAPRYIGPRGQRPLLCESDGLYFSQGARLFKRDLAGNDRLLVRLPVTYPQKLGSEFWWSSRISRYGIHFLVRSSDDLLYATVRNGVVRISESAGCAELVYRSSRGSRPLNLCPYRGSIYFGEYFRNTDRDPVRIFGSDNGDHWDVVHEFPAGQIRHVHGLVRDDYRRGIWVLTGDEGDEAGLWFTDDQFRSLEQVSRGNQKSRAVSVFPFPDGIVVPMDTPMESNFINFLSLPDCRFRRLAPMAGSGLYGARAAGVFLVGTCVEPSTENVSQYATLMASLDGQNWVSLAKAHRDLSFLHPRLAYFFQHPVLIPVSGSDDAERVHMFGIAVRSADGRMVAWDAAEFRSALQQ